MNATQFGQVLREVRINAGKTQGDIASLLGISVPYVSDIEHGKRNPLSRERIEQVAAFLGCDAAALHHAAALDRGEVTLPLGPTEAHRSLALSLAARWETAPEWCGGGR